MAISKGNAFPRDAEDAQRKSEKEGRPEIPQHEMIPAHALNEKIAQAIEDTDFDEN